MLAGERGAERGAESDRDPKGEGRKEGTEFPKGLKQCWTGYICEGMVSIININNGVKEPIHRYQNRNTSQILIFGWWICQGERIFVCMPDLIFGSISF